jgi:hypothetical protein
LDVHASCICHCRLRASACHDTDLIKRSRSLKCVQGVIQTNNALQILNSDDEDTNTRRVRGVFQRSAFLSCVGLLNCCAVGANLKSSGPVHSHTMKSHPHSSSPPLNSSYMFCFASALCFESAQELRMVGRVMARVPTAKKSNVSNMLQRLVF